MERIHSNITKYINARKHLNVVDIHGSEHSVATLLIKTLPPLHKLTCKEPPVKGGKARIYMAGPSEMPFYVKELVCNPKEGELVFKNIQEEFYRAYPFFEPYIVPTVFLQRPSTEKDRMEYLTIQDICEGIQRKSINSGRVAISEYMKGQVEDILFRQLCMYQETGFVLDLDFFLNTNRDQVQMFDLDCQMDNVATERHNYRELSQLLGITIPSGLLID